MAPVATEIGRATAVGSATCVITSGITVDAGDGAIVVMYQGTRSAASVTDSVGNTYTTVTVTPYTAMPHSGLSIGSTITVNLALSATTVALAYHVSEVDGYFETHLTGISYPNCGMSVSQLYNDAGSPLPVSTTGTVSISAPMIHGIADYCVLIGATWNRGDPPGASTNCISDDALTFGGGASTLVSNHYVDNTAGGAFDYALAAGWIQSVPASASYTYTFAFDEVVYTTTTGEGTGADITGMGLYVKQPGGLTACLNRTNTKKYITFGRYRATPTVAAVVDIYQSTLAADGTWNAPALNLTGFGVWPDVEPLADGRISLTRSTETASTACGPSWMTSDIYYEHSNEAPLTAFDDVGVMGRHVYDEFGSKLIFRILNFNGTKRISLSLKVKPNLKTNSNIVDLGLTDMAGKPFSAWLRPDGAAQIIYEKTDGKLQLIVLRKITSAAVFDLQSVQEIGTGEFPTHVIDRAGRLVVAYYDSGWKVRVGTMNADGYTYTFSPGVSMAIGSAASRSGQLLVLSSGTFDFNYLNASIAPKSVLCRQLGSDATGTWA